MPKTKYDFVFIFPDGFCIKNTTENDKKYQKYEENIVWKEKEIDKIYK